MTTVPFPPAGATRADARLVPAVLALDVGGTTIKAAVVDATGILATHRAPTDADPHGLDRGAQSAIDAVLGAVHDVWALVPPTHQVVGLGVVTPGVIDESSGVVLAAENLGWHDVPLRELLEDAVGVPVATGHDVRAGNLAEWRLGAGRGIGDHAFLAVGTGIAASLVLDGSVYSGGGLAGEVGHGGATTGTPCPCGGRGCVETYASAEGMARRYAERTGQAVDGSREVLSRAEAGDVVAQDVWAQGVDGLAQIVSFLARALGVRTVLLGGGLVKAGDALLRPLDAAVRRRLTVTPAPELRAATLGADAGTYGAAILAWGASGLPVPSTLGVAA